MTSNHPDLDIICLGRIEVRGGDGSPVRLRSHKALALLLRLARRPGEVVARDSLAGLLWGGFDNAHARANLRQAVLHLRHDLSAIGADVIRSEGHGLYLDTGRVRVDAIRFEALAGSQRREDLERALAL
ncbi:MAG: winged helix-turn-helix domain-containing protein [Rhodovibrionaceae bacterium]|nr:winged helix-turn-helix domain-containing protein [Rhodovibrionaceae bacterium]